MSGIELKIMGLMAKCVVESVDSVEYLTVNCGIFYSGRLVQEKKLFYILLL